MEKTKQHLNSSFTSEASEMRIEIRPKIYKTQRRRIRKKRKRKKRRERKKKKKRIRRN